jgi:hypothetical protein
MFPVPLFFELSRERTALENEVRALRDQLAAVTAERDEALYRVEELECNAERVADEFERDCWKALRSLLGECHFEWDGDAQLEGVSAEEAREHISTTLAECDRAAELFKAERDEARAEVSWLREMILRVGAGRFRLGDRLRKVKGSEWAGRVVGWYSTALTPIGYAIESEAHAGSVQIYPEAALEKTDDR